MQAKTHQVVHQIIAGRDAIKQLAHETRPLRRRHGTTAKAVRQGGKALSLGFSVRLWAGHCSSLFQRCSMVMAELSWAKVVISLPSGPMR